MVNTTHRNSWIRFTNFVFVFRHLGASWCGWNNEFVSLLAILCFVFLCYSLTIICSTTPGFDLNIPQGSVTEVGYKDGHTYHRNWDAEVSDSGHAPIKAFADCDNQIKWRAPHLNITQAKVYANVAVGPRIKIDIGMPGIKKASLGFQIRAEIRKCAMHLKCI
jgi:hypothetical protein